MRSGSRWQTSVLVLCSLASLSVVNAATMRYYVATNGNDAWRGELPEPRAGGNDGPFATVLRAKNATREHKAGRGTTCAYVVSIRGGTHRLTEKLVFTPEDSGTQACPVTYEAYASEIPILSGGKAIPNWKRGTGAFRHLWVAHIEEVRNGRLYFNQLFVDGVRRPRARTCLRAAGRSRALPEPLRSLRFHEGDFARWQNLDDVLIRAYSSWIVTLHWIEDLDLQNRIATFSNRGWEFGRFDAHQRYVIENYFDALDSPGEWFLRRDGALYYWPLDGERPNAVTVTAPVVAERLVEFAGDSRNGKYVEHVTFRGISLRHVDWTVKKDTWYDHQDFSAVKWATVYAQGLRHSRFENCEVCNTGVHGIYLDTGCQHNTIVRCHVHDTGGGGVYVGSRSSATEGQQGVQHNVVDNNFIHDVGQVFTGAVGVSLGHGSHNRVSHNEICDTDWSGMSIGRPNSPHSAGNLIEHNHVHHVLRNVLSDGAGIYTLGTSRGTVIRNNLIHDAYAYPTCPARGIYHDTQSADYTCENNIVHNVSGHGILHCGEAKRITVRNNIFAFCHKGGIRSPSMSGVIERNIVYNRDCRSMVDGKWGKTQFRIDRNVYWNVTHGPGRPRFGRQDLAAWQEMGHGRRSLVADPLFVDPVRYDFRLRKSSPALALGFVDIDMNSVGLYGDEEWIAMPQNARRHTAPPPVFPPQRLPDLNDDFESSCVERPPGCFSNVSEQEGRIRVTDETAASGRKCLKFTDAPGMKSFYPYMFDRAVKYESGTVTFSLDIKNSADLPGEARLLFRDHHTPRFAPTTEIPEGHSYIEGPVVTLKSDGSLTANGKHVAAPPLGRWAHVSVSFELGPERPKHYALEVGLLGQVNARAVKGLPFASKHFSVLTGVFILANMSPTDAHPVFYVDNLRLTHTVARGAK